MDDYFRWTPREGRDRRESIMKQTLMDDEKMMENWLNENQCCNEEYIPEEGSGYFDRYQDEIYKIQQENSKLRTDNRHVTQTCERILYEKETRIKQMNQHHKRTIDVLERKNDELWNINADLVEDTKTLEIELGEYEQDLEDQMKKIDKLVQRINDEVSRTEHIEVLLTTEQTQNISLKNEISRLNTLVNQTKSYERHVTNQKKSVEEENQTLKHEIYYLRIEVAVFRNKLITLQQQCDCLSKGREGNERDEWEQKIEQFQAKLKELKMKISSLSREKYSLQDEFNRNVAELSSSFGKEIQALQQKMTTYQHNEISSLKQNQENELALSQLKRQLISFEQEHGLALEKMKKQEEEIRLLKEEKDKMIQDKRFQRTYHKETTMYSKQETERRELEIQRHKQALENAQQTQRVMIQELEQRSKQAEDKLSVVNEQLHNERSRNDKLSKERTQNVETSEKLRALKNELESEKCRNTILSKKIMQYEEHAEHQNELNREMKDELSRNTMISMERTKYEDIAKTLQEVTKELESEKVRNAMLLKESKQYKEQIDTLIKAQVDLSKSHSLLSKENRQTQDIRIATEYNQPLNGNLSDRVRSKQDIIGEIGSLKDEVKKITDALESKERDINMLKSELQMKYHEIEDKQGELDLIKEINVKNERLVSDLQTEMNQYKRKLKVTSSDSDIFTNTISHLEREVREYKHELEKAREEIKRATDKNQQMNQNISDLQLSEHACYEKIDSLNDQFKDLTKRKDSDMSMLEIKLQRKCQELENTMANVALVKGQIEKNKQLVTDLQIELDKYKAKLKDQDSNSAEMNKIIKTLRRKVETYERELKQAQEEIRKSTEKSRLMDQNISALKDSEQSLIDERNSFRDKVIELTTILKRRDSEKREMEAKMAEISPIKEKKIPFENDKSNHSAEMNRTISNFKHEVEKNQSELKQAREETRKYALQLKTVNDEHGDCQTRIASLSKENEQLRSVSMYKGEQTRRSEAILSQREQELSHALEKARRELHEVQHELHDAKTRLSKVMGQKLTDNNPNIADLSDKNRPTKLAERYSELYDNQWTDAFEVVNKQLQDEKSTLDSLIDILMTAAKFCRGEAMKQMEEIQGILLPKKVGTALPSLVHKNLKDCRKALGDVTGAAVYEKYMEDSPRSLQQDVKPFVKECIELCWLMSIQDPPVFIEPVVQRGTKFDTDFYKAYTSSGPLVDYVVWPALCLHEKGPLLCKGIAQGYGGKKTKY